MVEIIFGAATVPALCPPFENATPLHTLENPCFRFQALAALRLVMRFILAGVNLECSSSPRVCPLTHQRNYGPRGFTYSHKLCKARGTVERPCYSFRGV